MFEEILSSIILVFTNVTYRNGLSEGRMAFCKEANSD